VNDAKCHDLPRLASLKDNPPSAILDASKLLGV
jgi:hypothetical protein